MVIKRDVNKKIPKSPDKKNPKLPKKEESPLKKISREYDERKLKEAEEKKQDEISALKETQRVEKVIKNHLDKLETQLKEKKLTHFWTFPWKSGFKKFHGDFDDIQKMVKQDDKYKNKTIMYCAMGFYQNRKEDSLHRSVDIWMGVSLNMWRIDDKGDMNGKYSGWGCHYMWTPIDFKLSKFSFKLMEVIMHAVDKKVTTCESLMGLPLTNVVDNLKARKVKFDDVLSPLANV